MHSSFYIPQTSHFSNVIHSFWQTERTIPFRQELIIPKGVIEVIFNFSDDSSLDAQLGARQYRLSDCFINGFNTAPIVLHPPGQQVFFGVQFKPLAVKKIFRTPACEFSDMLVDVALIDSAFRSLWHEMAEQSTFEARVSVFLRWMESNFPDCQPRDKLMDDFLLDFRQYDLSVSALADSLCYSPRHLSRKILEATGMNTEEMLLYKKYLHAVHLIHHTDLSLTEIAYECRFSDQSHFIKSFRAYTNMTPGVYRRNKSVVQGHIFEDVR